MDATAFMQSFLRVYLHWCHDPEIVLYVLVVVIEQQVDNPYLLL